MSDNNIEVKFGAQTSGLKDGAAQAASSLEQAIKRMENALGAMAKNVAASTQQVTDGLKEVQQSSRATADAVEGTAGALGRFASVAAVIAVAKAFADMADKVMLLDARLKIATKTNDDFAQAQKDIYRIAQSNNVGLAETTTLYSKLADPVRRMGGTTAETAAIVDAFSTSLRVSGASTAEANAATLQFAQAMASGKLQGDEFRSMAETSPRFMQALAEGMNVPVEKLKTMGSEGKLTADVVGNALIKSLDTLKTEAATIPDTAGGAFQRLQNDVMGTVKAMNESTKSTQTLAGMFDGVAMYVRELGKVFKDTEGSAGDLDQEFEIGTFLMKVFGTVVEAVTIVLANLKFVFVTIANDIVMVGRVMEALVKGNFKEIPKIIDDTAEAAKKSRAELDEFEQRVLRMTDNVMQARAKMKAGDESGTEKPTPAKPTLKSTVPPEDPNIMGKYEVELEKMKLAHERMNRENGTFYQFGIQREAEFWESKLANAGLKEDQRLAIEKKALSKRLELAKVEFEATVADYKVQMDAFKNNLAEKLRLMTEASEKIKQKYGEESKEYRAAQAQIVGLQREMAARSKAIEQEQAQRKAEAALGMVDIEQRAAELELALGQRTNAEMIAKEAELEEARKKIRRDALMDKLMLAEMDPDRNPLEVAKIHAQLEELEQQHQLRMTEIRGKATLEQTKYSRMFFDGMESGMTSVLQSFLKGTMRVRDMVRNMAGAILDAFTNMLAKWVVQQIMSSELIKSAKLQEAGVVVGANAGEAASGAAASQASIPYVGPAMAAAAFAATMALVLGAKKLFSASKGFDVPAGTNPVTQLHESEMVLPKEQADVIRGMAGGGGGGSPVTVHISAVDAKSVRDLFMREGAALADSIQKQARSFKMTPSTLKGAR